MTYLQQYVIILKNKIVPKLGCAMFYEIITNKGIGLLDYNSVCEFMS